MPDPEPAERTAEPAAEPQQQSQSKAKEKPNPEQDSQVPRPKCYVHLQYYIHCKHTEAQWHACLDDDGQPKPDCHHPDPMEEKRTGRAEIHSYDRLCHPCYVDALLRAAELCNQDTSSSNHLVLDSTHDVVFWNRMAGVRGGISNVNVNHLIQRGIDVAGMYGGGGSGGIDRHAALLEARDRFHLRPTHAARDDEPVLPHQIQEPPWMDTMTALGRKFVHEEQGTVFTRPAADDDVREILVHFAACGHFNAIACPTIARTVIPFTDNDSNVVWTSAYTTSRCGCDGFDERLATRQYAESREDCLVCRSWNRLDREGSNFGHMVRLVWRKEYMEAWPLTQSPLNARDA